MAADPHEILAETAEQELGVQESGKDNEGLMVSEFQRSVSGSSHGEPWCAAFVSWCVKKTCERLDIKTPFYASESTHVMWVKNELLVTPKPSRGMVVIWSTGEFEGHCGIVTRYDEGYEPEYFRTVEGNTTDSSGMVRNGDGVYEKRRPLRTFGRFVLAGFIDPFKTYALF